MFYAIRETQRLAGVVDRRPLLMDDHQLPEVPIISPSGNNSSALPSPSPLPFSSTLPSPPSPFHLLPLPFLYPPPLFFILMILVVLAFSLFNSSSPLPSPLPSSFPLFLSSLLHSHDTPPVIIFSLSPVTLFPFASSHSSLLSSFLHFTSTHNPTRASSSLIFLFLLILSSFYRCLMLNSWPDVRPNPVHHRDIQSIGLETQTLMDKKLETDLF